MTNVYSSLQIQNSRPTFHAQSPWTPAMEHARGSAEILNIARSAGPCWIFTSQTLSKFSFWGNLAYHKISPNFNFFQEIFKFSCPWARPGCTLNFCHRIFQKLTLAPSETTIWNLRLDKRKTQTTDRLSSTDPKREKNAPKKTAQDSTNLAPTIIEQYCFTSLVLKKPSLQAIFNQF